MFATACRSWIEAEAVGGEGTDPAAIAGGAAVTGVGPVLTSWRRSSRFTTPLLGRAEGDPSPAAATALSRMSAVSAGRCAVGGGRDSGKCFRGTVERGKRMSISNQ